MDETYRQWGDNIAKGMTAVGIRTHAELGKTIGVTQQSATRWIRGQAAPSDRHKVLLARALHQDVQQLFPLNRGVAA